MHARTRVYASLVRIYFKYSCISQVTSAPPKEPSRNNNNHRTSHALPMLITAARDGVFTDASHHHNVITDELQPQPHSSDCSSSVKKQSNAVACVRTSMVSLAPRVTRMKQGCRLGPDVENSDDKYVSERDDVHVVAPQHAASCIPKPSSACERTSSRKVDGNSKKKPESDENTVIKKHVDVDEDQDMSMDMCVCSESVIKVDAATSDKHMQRLEQSTLALKRQLQAAHSACADLMEEVTKLRRDKVQMKADLHR
jgi:hypothetical protein